MELEAQEYNTSALYVGREADEKKLRRAVSAPPRDTPTALHAVGHHGIGRRTFLRNSLAQLYPRYFGVFIEITMSSYQGIEEFYRAIYDVHIVSSLEKSVLDFTNFASISLDQQVSTIVDMIKEMATNGEFLLILDDGGAYTEDGDYQPFLVSILSRLSSQSRPTIGFVQTRMMPFSLRQKYPRSYHEYLRPLTEDDVSELLSLSLKELDIDFTKEQLIEASQHLDGHPYNVRFAVQFIDEYGIQSLINDPTDLIEWKRKRAEDFLRKIIFSRIEVDIIGVFHNYQYIASDMLIGVLGAQLSEVAQALRRLEEYCCIERRGAYYFISAPVRDAVRRDKRFEKDADWLKHIGQAICDAIKDYEGDDAVSVPILESATLAAARGGSSPAYLAALILPSHLLRLARDSYDGARRADCIDFCKRAFEMKQRLPNDGQVELLRLWGLSVIRLNDDRSLEIVLNHLSSYTS